MGIVIPNSVGGTAEESSPSNRLVIPESVGGTDPDPVQQQPDEMGAWESTKSVFTGKGRTEFEDMPEFDLPFEMKSRQFKTALGLLTTFDKNKQMKVLKSNGTKECGSVSKMNSMPNSSPRINRRE